MHADRVSDIADQAAIPSLKVLALMCKGLSETTSKRYGRASGTAGGSSRACPKANAGLEYEPRILADLADARYRQGLLDQATALSQHAVECAQQRGARLAELHSRIIQTRIFGGEQQDKYFHRAQELLMLPGVGYTLLCLMGKPVGSVPLPASCE